MLKHITDIVHALTVVHLLFRCVIGHFKLVLVFYVHNLHLTIIWDHFSKLKKVFWEKNYFVFSFLRSGYCMSLWPFPAFLLSKSLRVYIRNILPTFRSWEEIYIFFYSRKEIYFWHIYFEILIKDTILGLQQAANFIYIW